MWVLSPISITSLHINYVEHRVFGIILLLLFTRLSSPQFLLLLFFNLRGLLVILTQASLPHTVILPGVGVIFLDRELQGGLAGNTQEKRN